MRVFLSFYQIYQRYIIFLSLIFLGVDQYLTPVVELTFVPVCTVVQMRLTCSRVFGNLRSNGLVVSSSLISSLLRRSSFRMCHFYLFFVY